MVGPFRQSERMPIYQAYVEKLVKTGHAYLDFRPPSAESESTPGQRLEQYNQPSTEEAQNLIDQGHRYVVRFKLPTEKIEFDDVVFGSMSVDPKDLGNDPVLIKSDGWPTYHLASVVDDIEMGITHVLRGEEWLPSAGKHLALFQALGCIPPAFAHLPLLINPDGSKLSKRSGDTHVQSYIDRGYEPEALINFIGLMGYNHKNAVEGETQEGAQKFGESISEVMTIENLIEGYDSQRIARSRATPFFPKLDFLNRQHLRQALSEDAQGYSTLLFRRHEPAQTQRLRRKRYDILFAAQRDLEAVYGQQPMTTLQGTKKVVHLVKEQLNTTKDIVQEARFLFVQPDWSSSNAQKALRGTLTRKDYPQGVDIPTVMKTALNAYVAYLRTRSDHAGKAGQDRESHDPLTNILPKLAGEIQPNSENDPKAAFSPKALQLLARKTLRWAMTGGEPGPAVSDVIDVMPKKMLIKRLENARDSLDDAVTAVRTQPAGKPNPVKSKRN
ncbi:Glutamate--tRNA ligase mitochondrial [Tilletia horrida]|uniref:Glutamate--tRNA ligase mitochondrial n=1 Tax=Tilletia horrida TaxID=155126 RepID=A0AAN6GU68_9BASI|nr:Glutamate--tRNA ligase mitochondrial [Tilletia horrida]